jgi:NAD-dependent deacetylase
MAGGLKRVLVVTGSGISAESGIPTFRGQDGYWRNLDPRKLATEEAFRRDPQLVWDWYREQRALVHRSRPNAAHIAVVELAARSGETLVLTQNVDDLHARAEWNGRRLAKAELVQIHGRILATRCLECDFSRDESSLDASGVPACPRCGAPLRPGVVWFGEQLDPKDVRRVGAFLARGSCNLVLVIGTTATFGYITNWALQAKGRHGQLIEINPEESALSPFAAESIREPAAQALPLLVTRLIADGPAE